MSLKFYPHKILNMASKRVLPHCASLWLPMTSWEVSIIVWRGFNFNYYPLSLHSSRLQKRVLSILCSTASLWLLLSIFVRNVFETNVNFKYQGVKNQKKVDTILISTFKIDITRVPLFFLIFYLLTPKIDICLKYFLTKIPKSSHSVSGLN